MPAYEYQCINCLTKEVRFGGVDDKTAICMECGHLMLRVDVDVFRPYFDKQEKEAEVRKNTNVA
ncbi:MAG: hypothetical protein BZ151_05180 [Desulfobacca sp. 4484_104]|nr:MAG: hypothetical protein BZ151_05180 [Desulfobacca sp. 4484_104]RLA89419.1 MAG: hypothetical protein DRG58_05215 [Deltaproteobacteria bacterium]